MQADRWYRPPSGELFASILSPFPAHGNTALILTAHPDDEAMFFAPAILSLVEDGWSVQGLCLSIGQSRLHHCRQRTAHTPGDQAGLGQTRRKELFASYDKLGVSADEVFILDDL
jgi:N-acetylglucosaminylphosphatidylinositol deacetylase